MSRGKWETWMLEPCGTAAAYRRHLRQGEPACQACKDAHRDYQRRWTEDRAAK